MKISPQVKWRIIEELAAENPQLWAKCYPRIYNEVPAGRYPSVREVAGDLLSAAVNIEDGFMGENEKVGIVLASMLVMYGVPIYWLTRDMAEALKQTTPPSIVDLRTAHFPFEAAVIMLPEGTLPHEGEEGEARFVSYCRTRPGMDIPSLARIASPKGWHVGVRGALNVFAHTTIEHLMHWTLPDDKPLDLGKLDDIIQKFGGEWQGHGTEFPDEFRHEMDDADNRLMARVLHLIMGALALIVRRPDLVTGGELQKRVQRKSDRPREFWSPRIIGEHYKLRREYVPQGGTHASPRGHWVRGFYREQPYGPRVEGLRKEVWIEPFWRGGE
jgi:hypothetical protein